MRVLPLLIVLLISLSGILTSAGDYPKGYSHRPIMEFFTSTSCTYCMHDADPAISKLWVEEGNTPEQPWTFVAFHQTNGGNHDDPLVTNESRERYDYYMVFGTPDAQFDGGYIDDSGGGDDCYERYSQDFDDSGSRDDESTSLTDFKDVVLYVQQYFDGSGFRVNVTVTYPVDPQDKFQVFNGHLYVFMVEDGVWVYSSILEEIVIQHNVFRGYAIKDETFTLNPGESATFQGRWEIPLDVKVPVNPQKVFAVAAVYDDDDTTSGRGGDGNKANTPRAVQSSTPNATAYDMGWSGPEIHDISLSYSDGKWTVSAYFDDEDNITGAWIFYTTNGSVNTTDWKWTEFSFSEECTGGTCSVYGSGLGTAEIHMDDRPFHFRIIAYDGNWTYTFSPYMFSGNMTSSEKGGSGSSESMPMDSVVLLMAVAIGMLLYAGRKRVLH